MHARYYDPYISRWIQPDTIVPEPGNPQSLNRYSYVYNRPLVFVDRDGHFPWPVVIIPAMIVGGVVIGGAIGVAVVPDLLPWDPPMMITDRVADPITSNHMTGWLRNQLVTNAQSDVVRAIRENWHSGNPLKKDAAMQAWTALVGTDNTWDFKYDIRDTEWYARGERDVVLGSRTLNYNAVANLHFGYVGRAAGFSSDFLVIGAGFAQVKHYLFVTQDPNDRGTLSCWGDHPYATYFVRFGSYLYENYDPEQLDENTFAAALEAYIEENGEPPDPPPGAVAP